MNDLKRKIAHDLKLYLFYAIYLTMFFWSFKLYRRLILEEYSISLIHYGYSLVEALVLAKIIMIGQMLNIGERKHFHDKPLIYSIVYKTIVFCIFVFIFAICEHFIIGWFEGKDMAHLYQDLMSHSIYSIYASMLLMFLFFIVFFAFLEIGQFLGEGQLIKLLFVKKEKNS